MTRPDCEAARPLLDLYAAGACDAAERRAVRSHLDACPDCRASLAESRAVLGLLDLHYGQPRGLDRLRRRIEQEQAAARPRLLLFVRRYAALAAMVLVTVGLALAVPVVGPGGGPSASLQAVVVPGQDRLAMEMAHPKIAAPARGKDEAEAPAVQLSRRSPARWKELVRQAPAGQPPAPPTLTLDIRVTNTGPRPLLVEVGGPGGRCLLTLTGPEVVRRSAPGGLPPVAPATLRLRPGEEKRIPLLRLASQVGGTVVYLYPVTAGEYTLSAELWARVREEGQSEERLRTLRLGPVTLRVK